MVLKIIIGGAIALFAIRITWALESIAISAWDIARSLEKIEKQLEED